MPAYDWPENIHQLNYTIKRIEQPASHRTIKRFYLFDHLLVSEDAGHVPEPGLASYLVHRKWACFVEQSNQHNCRTIVTTGALDTSQKGLREESSVTPLLH